MKQGTKWATFVKHVVLPLVTMKQTRDLIMAFILKLLGMQMMGGFRAYLLKHLVGKFQRETADMLRASGEYSVMLKTANDTQTMEDRDEATDNLNDLMR